MKKLYKITAGAMAAAMLLLTGCSGTTAVPNPGSAVGNKMLHLASYPEYPSYPEEPVLGDWSGYQEQYDRYREQINTIRGERSDDAFIETVKSFADSTMSTVLTGAGSENRVYSPLNLFLALSMLSRTAAGESQAQVLALLGEQDADRLAEQTERLWRWIYMDNGISALRPAASLWLNESLNFKDATLKEICEDYRASSARVAMGTDEADALIGSWLAEMTGGVLENLAVETNPDDVMALYSTLYYSDQWTDEFDKSKTAEDIFTCADGTEVAIDFLNRETHGNFVGDEGFQAASLGLKNGSMTFILPDEGVSIDELLSDPTFWERVEGNPDTSHYGEVIWQIPKFSAESTVGLKSALQSLGVTDIFDAESADFTPLTDSPAWVGNIRQGAGVEVDERGVTAAAYTEIMYAGAALPDGRCEMILDRPFMFLIRSGSYVLFAGIVNAV